jgi:hypothetical protein
MKDVLNECLDKHVQQCALTMSVESPALPDAASICQIR